jgi:NACHT domain
MEPISTTQAVTTTASFAFKTAVPAVFAALSKGRKNRLIAEQSDTAVVERVNAHIAKLSSVTSIWSPDRTMNLDEFYLPPSLEFRRAVKLAESINDLPNWHVVVEGGAGQGKSFFLRHLCLELMRRVNDDIIPVYVELKTFEPETSLKGLAIKEMRQMGFDLIETEADFDVAIKTGRFVLVLDGFDEVPGAVEKQCLLELSELILYCDSHLRIIVSSRPNQAVSRLPSLTAVTIAELSTSDVLAMARKYGASEAESAAWTDSLKNSSNKILDLVRTPLMVVLLVLKYKGIKKIPEEFSDFFDPLFWTLIQRHDEKKPGFSRDRLCGLTDHDIKKVFETFCFVSRKHALFRLTDSQAHTFVEEAAKFHNQTLDTTKFLSDLIRITGLVQKDGIGHYCFSHVAVQKYFAASHVTRCVEPQQATFYDWLAGDVARWERWYVEIFFLVSMERNHLFLKLFWLPQAHHLLKSLSVDSFESHSSNITKIVTSYMLSSHAGQLEKDSLIVYYEPPFSTNICGLFLAERIFREQLAPVIRAATLAISQADRDKVSQHARAGFPFSSLLSNSGHIHQARSDASVMVGEWMSRLRDIEKGIAAYEHTAIMSFGA